MKIGIGIDTGGTYTDAVAYDFQSGSILGSAKSLTTKEDLTVGILSALDGLPVDLLKQAELVSLSTTLATNACVEDKGGKAKLVFFGGDKKIIAENGGKYGLPHIDDIYIQESYTDFWGGTEREPDWELFAGNLESFRDFDGVGIIEMNAMKNGAAVEKKAKRIFTERHDIPVICSHELFSELNCLQRGSSTLLNAGLFPVIKEFLDAIKAAVKERGINAAVVIVRSDGSLMSEEFAAVRPVETLLCGPAASVIGSTQLLAGEANCVIIDMGGTTTDIALVRDNMPVTAVDGVSIGKWKTFVNGLYVKTFGLGGDSAVHHSDNGLILEEYRVVPLCIAAEKYPVIINNLRELLANTGNKHMKYLHEHYILVKDISASSRYTQEERAFCNALKDKPLILKEAAAAVGKDIYTLNVSRLLKEGVVQVCGLTPTDIMHIKGDFSKYSDSIEASVLGAKFAAFNLDISIDKLCELVYDEIKRRIYLNVVKVTLENKDPYYMKNGVGKEVERFINDSYETAKSGKKGGLVSAVFETGFTLAGIGAPIHIFLDDVAKMLGTKAVIPKYSEVANALGAVAGNVCASYTVEIKPNHSPGGITGYTVFGNEVQTFDNLADAEEFAESEAREGAYNEALKRGAQGEITVTCGINMHTAPGRSVIVHLNTSVTAQAVGAIGFSHIKSGIKIGEGI